MVVGRVQMTPSIKRLTGAFLAAFLLMSRGAVAEPLQIYAAGSLTAAFTDIVKAFPTAEGSVAAPVFGPSGVLREKIEHGDRVDLLASADMEQPRTLARSRPGTFGVMFTRNRLCALGRASLGLTSDNMLDRLLDPSVRLATSTPGADPGGDYAWAVFARAEAGHPGAQAILQEKAMKLVGGPNSTPLVPGRGAVQGIFLARQGRRDAGLLQQFGTGHAGDPGPGEHAAPALTDRRTRLRTDRLVRPTAGCPLRIVRAVRAGSDDPAATRLRSHRIAVTGVESQALADGGIGITCVAARRTRSDLRALNMEHTSCAA